MIIAGFVGVGKTRAAMEWDNCVNIELSPLYQFQPEYPSGGQAEASKELHRYILNPLYPYNAILKILREEASEKWVIINAVESILTPLAKEYQRRCILVYPDASLRGAYRRIYRRRGNNGTFIRRMMEEWDGRLQFLSGFGCGSVHFPLRSDGCYLSGIRAPLERLWESAQPPVSAEVLCELEEKLDKDSKSYYLTDSQNRCALPVDLRSVPLREYLCSVASENMPRPALVRHPPNGAIQVNTLEEFRRKQVPHDS